MPESSGPDPARAPRRRRRITLRLTSQALRNPWLAAGLLFGALLGLALVLVFIGAVGVVTQNPCGAGNENQAPGGGQWVAASTYGGPGDPSVRGDGGAYGHLAGTMAFAELSNDWSAPLGQLDFSALGKLPPHAKVRVTYKRRSVVAMKLDVGAGGPGFKGHKRAIDLWYQTAQALHFSGLDLVQVEPVSGDAQLTAAAPSARAPPTAATAAGNADRRDDAGEADARRAAGRRRGRVAFAVVDAHGALVAGYRPTETFHGGSITKAMLLVARLRDLGQRAPSASERSVLEAMIERSDNAAGNREFARVGATGVLRVARAAGMTHFDLRASDPDYRLGDSLVTAADQARLFARIDELVPAAQRSLARDLLGNVQEGAWGIVDAADGQTVLSKAGWRPEGAGRWTVVQGAQVVGRGVAVMTAAQPDQAYGQQSIETVARPLLDGAETGAGTETGQGACAGGEGRSTAQCNGQSYRGPTVSGEKAKLLSSGAAVPPDRAPDPVKCMIAAGNQIHRIHYVYGGCHGPPLIRPCAAAEGYDCSSSTSFVLLHGGVLATKTALTSGELAAWGKPGAGRWVTVYANGGHVYSTVAGLRFDTGGQFVPGRGGPPGSGPRWASSWRPSGGFAIRHPEGL